ncbi:motility protein A [Thermodesulfobacteriota bacterium]
MPIAIIEAFVVVFLVVLVSFLQKDIRISEFFLSSSAFLITFGGTMAASLIHFSTKEIVESLKFLKHIFLRDQISPDNMANMVIELSKLFKDKGREGLKIVRGDISHPILLTGIDLLSVDMEDDEFSELFEVGIKRSYSEVKKFERVFREMGVYAPMFGLFGTLVGLIQLLRELSSPQTIAPNMAIALVTTLYGIALAGFVFMPISGKIKTKSEVELKNSQIIYDGFIMIKKGYGPFAVEQKLRAYM